MISGRTLWRLAVLLLALGLGPPLAAQDLSGDAVQQAGPAADATGTIILGGGTGAETVSAPDELSVIGVDLAGWETVAERAEGVVSRGQGSSFVLRRLRADLVEWRDLFLADQFVHERRIQTVGGQLSALGPAPTDGQPPEDSAVTDRRKHLEEQLAGLRAPGRLAQEAHARADGLIREIDVLLRGKARAQLLERGPSPLTLSVWRAVAAEAMARATGLTKEIRVSLTSQARLAVLSGNWAWVLLFVALAWVLFRPVRRATDTIVGRLTDAHPRGRAIWDLLGSLARAALPVAGVAALVAAMAASGMFGYRATRLMNVLPLSVFYIFAARWLAHQVFGPEAPALIQFAVPHGGRIIAERQIIHLGVVLAFLAPVESLIDTGDIAPETRAALLLPFEIAIAIILFRIGRSLSQRSDSDAPAANPGLDNAGFAQQFAQLVGRLVMTASVVAPVLSIMGYGLAARSLLHPTVLTLGLVAVVILLQVLVSEVYAFVVHDEKAKLDSLVPLLGAFSLVTLAVPVGALIWGARVEDLKEIWTRFRDGYTIGDTRISPADIVTFVIVFGVGFAVTRLIQGILRGSVLPKTRFDIGSQNAIIAGLGYFGIFLSAMVAISTTGLNLSNLAIVAGALSVGIGFGLQNIVSNFVAGIILLIERPISEGDWIEVGGRMGHVREISVRSTRIETFDRTDVIVPNADLVSGQVVNWTRGNLVGRVIVTIGVSFSSDIDRVTAILREIAEAHPMVLMSPPPTIALVNLGADALNFEIRALVRDINFGLAVRSEINASIARRFREEGVDVPFPQRDVWVRNPEALRPDPRAWSSRSQQGCADAGEDSA